MHGFNRMACIFTSAARDRTCGVQWAVRPMTGTCFVRSSARSAAASSNPLMPGSVMSVTTTSGGLRRAIGSALVASGTPVGLNPALARNSI